MKKITLLLGFMVSCAIFSQEETPKMYKATPLKKTIYGKSSLSNQVSKSIQTTSSRSSGGGTVNGSTVDHLSVSLAGGVNYSVPIDVPPGLNGVQPKLAWTYDSHTGNGLAGWGWNISGISVITRIPSTLFHDNLVDGVDFDDNDRFALDGQRLIVKTGNYGGNGSVYQTEQYSNLKVISYGSHPESGIQGPASFKVFYPDGSIGHYGLINGSQNAISKMDYAISYWENPQGLRISYTYTKDNGTLYVDTITYGSKGQAAPINEVEFLYVDRIFRETAYVGGHQFIKSKRLYKIDVKGAFGVLYKSYAVSTIGGNSTLNYTRVSTIFERSGDNSQSREISFDYYGGTYSSSGIHDVGIDETPTFAGQLSINNVKKSNGSVISLDFTGNGELDFLVYPTTGPDTRKKFWMFTDVDGSYNYSSAINTGVFRDLFPVNWLQSNNQLSSSEGIAVVQDEGNTQIKFSIIGQGGPQVNGGPETKYSKIWDGPTYQMASDCSSQTLFRVPLKYVSGDFNGDGLSDVIAIERNYSSTECSEQPLFGGETCSNIVVRDGNQYCCYCSSNIYNSSNVHLIELDRRKTTNFVTNLGQLGRQLALSDVLIPLDVNGDGKTDILQFQDGEVFVYSIGDNGTLKFLWSTPDTAIDLEFPIMPGDYNGDGKTDFMMATANNSNNFVMFLSTGVGFEKKDYSTQNFEYRHDYTDNGTNYGYNLIPADMNGDGKTDIIEYKTTTYTNSTNGSQYIRIHQNAVKAISSNYPQFFASDPKQSTGNLETFPIPIFLSSNQENGGLQFASISDKWVTGYKSLKDHREDVTLKRITNNGLTTDIKYDVANLDYQNTTDPDYFKSYSTPGDELFPFVNIKAASSFKVVRELQQTGSGLTRTRRFYYEGAVSHANGLGFQGFEVVKQSNWYGDGVPALWTITKHDPLLRGFMTEKIISEEYLTNPSSFMSKVNYFYDYQLVANPGSPTAPQYQSTYILDYTIPGVLTRTAEESITLSPGFYANGANGLFLAEILPPEEQPGDFGYAGAVDIRLNRIEKTDGLTGVFSSETYSYDTYNNPLVTTTTFSEGSRVLTYTYANNAGATNNTYHIGKPTKMTERLTLNGNSFTTEEQYGYNNNLMTQIKRKGDGTDWVIQDLTYDTYGNIITKTQSSNGLTTRVENFEYSNAYNNRFLTKSTDIEGLETTFSYNAFTGLLIRKTGPFGLATSYQHDAWYRIAKETDYLNNDTDHTYTQITGGELQHDIDYSDGSREMTYYNAFGWVTRSGALSLNNEWSYVDYEHDVSGRVKRESQPHNGSPSQWNTMAYDAYGRPISEQLFTGRNITMTYSGLSSTVNDGVKSVTTTLDALGNTIKVQDPGGTIDYTYHASGQLKTADYGGHVVSVGVDGWGRKTSLNDPSAGNYTYSYNNYGELLEQTSPKGTTTYTYDGFGKPLTKTVVGDLTDLSLTYSYDPTTKLMTGINGVDNTNSGRAYVYEYGYDTYQRPNLIKENTGLANYEYRIAYDPTYGRVEKETYITNLVGGASKTLITRNVYDTSGILKEIWNDGTPDKLWELNQINPRGQAVKITLGNGIEKNKVYDSYGYVTKIEDKETGTNPTVALHTEYDFNVQRGNLTSRENFGFNWQENFNYDSLDRLTSISGDVTHAMTYTTRGNIDNNTALGDYVYSNTASKYQLTEIDPNTLGSTYFQQNPTQQISYNAFKKPIDIHRTGHGRVSFEYGVLMNRSTAYYGGDNVDKSLRRYKKHYSAIMPVEIVEDTQANTDKIITYVGGDAYSAPIVHIKTTGTGAIDEYHYLHRDYLGSFLAITDADGDVIEERQFGAWGIVDQFSSAGGSTTFDHTSLLGRGYTGHEHFFEVGLIHMNGRMYDAKLGRFLSPDNFVQEPFNTQSFNRYGYVLNNPLKYSDPTGEFFVTAAIIGAIIGGVSQAFKPGANFGSILGGVVVGAISGALGAGVTNGVAGGGFFGGEFITTMGFGSGFTAGFSGGFTAGFIGGSGSAWLQGRNLGDGLLAGLTTGIISGTSAGLVNGVASGIRAVKDGRDFWKGETWHEYKIGEASTVNSTNPFSETEEFLREWDVEERMNIPKSVQNGDECLVACKRGIDDYFGVTGQSEINSKWSAISLKENGLSDAQGFNMFREGGYRANLLNKSFNKKNVLPFIAEEMKQNRAVIISAKVTPGTGHHANVVKSIKYLGDFSRFKITTMNPSGGAYINPRNFRSYNNLFSVWIP